MRGKKKARCEMLRSWRQFSLLMFTLFGDDTFDDSFRFFCPEVVGDCHFRFFSLLLNIFISSQS